MQMCQIRQYIQIQIVNTGVISAGDPKHFDVGHFLKRNKVNIASPVAQIEMLQLGEIMPILRRGISNIDLGVPLPYF
jgi:hypothetical protein